MSLFKRLLGSLIGGGQRGDGVGGNAFWVYVQCAACGEKICVRVNREHDLSAEFEGESDAPTGYRTAKEVVGQNCFRRIHVELDFDRQRQAIDRRITGGSFITQEEYEAAQPTPV